MSRQFHYYSSGKNNKQRKEKRSRTRSNIFIFVVILFAGIIFAANLYVDTSSVNVEISQVEYASTNQEYSDQIIEILAQSWLNKAKIGVNYESIEQEIEAQFPEVADARVSSPIVGSTINVSLTLHEPVLVVNNGSDYLVNRQGRVLSKSTKGGQNLPMIFDRSSVPVEAGANILTSSQVKFVLEVEGMHEKAGKNVEYFELPRKTTNQLNVRLTGEEYDIYYNFLLDPKIQTGKYYATIDTLKEQGRKANEYIDVRVGERAFVK